MAEVAHSREDHGEAGLVRCSNHFVVADGSARLDDGRRTGFYGGKQPIGEREEGI